MIVGQNFVGDMGPASNPAEAESIPPELRDRAFQFRPVWQRFLIVLAGPMANFLLAILIFAAFFSLVGTPLTNVVGAVAPNKAAAAAGMLRGPWPASPHSFSLSPLSSSRGAAAPRTPARRPRP